MKIGGEAKPPKISKTQKWFGEIPPGWRDIKIINIFNGVPMSKLRKIKILMGINKDKGDKLVRDDDQVCFNFAVD